MTNLIQTYVRKLKKQLMKPTGAIDASDEDQKEIRIKSAALSIRPAFPEDGERLLNLHERLSRESLYFRFLSFRTPALHEMEMIAEMSSDQGAAVVASFKHYPHVIIGLAYYRHDPHCADTDPELAMVVEDRYQGCGVGRVLLTRLCRHAEAYGLKGLRAVIHLHNSKMHRLLDAMPYTVEDHVAGDMTEANIRFQPQPKSRWSGFPGVGKVTNPFSGLDLELDM